MGSIPGIIKSQGKQLQFFSLLEAVTSISPMFVPFLLVFIINHAMYVFMQAHLYTEARTKIKTDHNNKKIAVAFS